MVDVLLIGLSAAWRPEFDRTPKINQECKTIFEWHFHKGEGLPVDYWRIETPGRAAAFGRGLRKCHPRDCARGLGDGQNGARYIANVTGRSYYFVAPVNSRLTNRRISNDNR